MVNPFVWYDLMTPDVTAAAAFYEKIVDWKVIPSSIVTDGTYHVLSRGDHEFGGMMTTPPEALAHKVAPHWGGYIYVEDVDAHSKRVVELGGKIVRGPWDIPGACRACVVADPWGATFNIMSPLGDHDGEGPNRGDIRTMGNVGWNELMTGDLDAAWEFYAGLFGWQKTEALDMGPMGIYQMFGIGSDVSVGAMMKAPQDCANMQGSAAPHAWQYYFNVASIDVAAAQVTEHGGTIMMGPHEVPGGMWIIIGRDPQGAFFALVAPSKA